MKKEFVSLSLLIAASVAAFPLMAATGSISSTEAAQIRFVYSDGSSTPALNQFHASTTKFPSGTLSKAKKLTQVNYSVASYPIAYTESVDICYYLPYQTSPTKCIVVPKGISGTTSQFNELRFDYGARIQIQHKLTGKPGENLHPSQKESITWEYTY
ncbi:hypothetical protein [Pectobacterium polaris]|uniref:hypothetical protein n=1 Tax=Pectobacterium polaris TaxID=2042057 RepID=UPI0021C6D360|nr:hypothetical protein [Pectobacterium polaris]